MIHVFCFYDVVKMNWRKYKENVVEVLFILDRYFSIKPLTELRDIKDELRDSWNVDTGVDLSN